MNNKKNILELKKQIIDCAYKAGEGHIPSAFSVLDILWVLYDKVLNLSPKNVQSINRDRFVLSKGHASLGLYAVLAEFGFFDKKELDNFGKWKSILGGHPDCNKIPGVEISSGSLGHGLPIAVGMALGLKIRNSKAKVYCIVGDGEANEGSIWESTMLASHHKLNNLICIIDYNHSTDRALEIGSLKNKFEAFGWKALDIDGHDHKQILRALKQEYKNKPLAIIAKTVKGCGAKLIENNPAWHHKAPSKKEFEIILKQLEERYK